MESSRLRPSFTLPVSLQRLLPLPVLPISLHIPNKSCWKQSPQGIIKPGIPLVKTGCYLSKGQASAVMSSASISDRAKAIKAAESGRHVFLKVIKLHVDWGKAKLKVSIVLPLRVSPSVCFSSRPHSLEVETS